jgi:rare lipoprotein A
VFEHGRRGEKHLAALRIGWRVDANSLPVATTRAFAEVLALVRSLDVREIQAAGFPGRLHFALAASVAGRQEKERRMVSTSGRVRLAHVPRLAGWLLALSIALLFGGCATKSPGAASSGPFWDRDGPERNPPADLQNVPDADPKLESILPGGPNKPYSVLGHSYVPITQDQPFTERGLASWYGRKFQGKRTSSGELYNMYAMTAAHPTLPIPSYARVRNPANGREVIVRINDRGPFHSERIVDLSYTAALKLDVLRGVAPVELTRLTSDDIRTGAWKRSPLDLGATRVASAADVQPVSATLVGALGSGAAAPAATLSAPTPSPTPSPDTGGPARTGAAGAVTTPGAAVAMATPTPIARDPAPAVPSPLPPSDAAASAPASAAAPAPSDAASVPAPVADAPQARAYTRDARGYYVQLGAFRLRDGAVDFQKRVERDMGSLAPLLAIFSDASLYRLQAGPFPSRDEARGAAEQIRGRLQLVPVIVERR